MNFAEHYCARHRLPRSSFETAVLDHCLYPKARRLHRLLVFFRRDYFASDLELVRNVGRLTRTRDFPAEAAVFWHHPANSGWWRRRGGLRISTHRLLRLMETTGLRD